MLLEPYKFTIEKLDFANGKSNQTKILEFKI